MYDTNRRQQELPEFASHKDNSWLEHRSRPSRSKAVFSTHAVIDSICASLQLIPQFQMPRRGSWVRDPCCGDHRPEHAQHCMLVVWRVGQSQLQHCPFRLWFHTLWQTKKRTASNRTYFIRSASYGSKGRPTSQYPRTHNGMHLWRD